LRRAISAPDLADNSVPQNSHLRAALDNRDVIAQAKGILMASQMITEPEAFQRLASESQRTNITVRDIAARIVTQHQQQVAE